MQIELNWTELGAGLTKEKGGKEKNKCWKSANDRTDGRENNQED